jgi:SecD/SecF fusion protein
VIALGALAGFIYSRSDYKFGLDVRGGVRFTYQMDTAKLSNEQRQNLGDIQSRIQTILLNRATGAFGVAEPVVVPKGEDQFVIELPGYTNIDEARGIIGSSARIEFYHATTVRSQDNPAGIYNVLESKDETPEVSFSRVSASSDSVIKPGTPEYDTMIKTWTPILAGEDLARADVQPAGSYYQPVMQFSISGQEKISDWTRRFQNKGPQIAAVLDGKVLSIARLQDNTILSDNAVITGQFSASYVKRLVDLLNAGSLPVDLKELSSEKVDPTIGKTALDKMVFAGLISFGVIALFLVVYYAFPGVVALIALGLYVLFTLTTLKMFGATFSLASIAGFILSVGMAVDANVLVFERFKEEMKAGKSLQSGIQLGFGRALPAIIDSNVCTIITSIVLATLGSGPVKGFATTLIIGLAISLFTAITVTRSLLLFLVGTGVGTNPKFYAIERSWFGEKFEDTANTNPIKILQKTRLWIAISVATIVIGIPFVYPLNGLKPNFEFRGGYEVQYSVSNASLDAGALTKRLEEAGIAGTNVKFGGEGSQRLAIITAPRDGALQGLDGKAARDKITQAAGFSDADVRNDAAVGPAIQAELIRNAILGVLISSGLITLYLALRFGFGVGGFRSGLRFASSAIVALLHDILVVLGVTAIVGFLYGWEISGLFITSMLTVIGFSVHDTIVIFDRIRENLAKPLPDEDFEFLVNRSVSQSFARSINTSMTVIVTLIILLVTGTTTPDLKLFCVTMLVGIISGTYSSIFNASPILWLLDKSMIKRHGEGASLTGLARADAAKRRVYASQAATSAAAAGTGTSATNPGSGRSYGQVRRRNSAVDRSKREIDEP